jgi:hypothetical protein
VFVFSGKGLCEGPIPRAEESYRMWCAFECDQVEYKPSTPPVSNQAKERRTMERNSVLMRQNSASLIWSHYFCSWKLAHVQIFTKLNHQTWVISFQRAPRSVSIALALDRFGVDTDVTSRRTGKSSKSCSLSSKVYTLRRFLYAMHKKYNRKAKNKSDVLIFMGMYAWI